MTELAASSSIESVTLYREGALVTRVAQIDLPGPCCEVVLGGMPLTLQDGSLRFGVDGEGDDLPLAVDAVVELAAGGGSEAVEPAIDQELEAAALHEAQLRGRVEQLRGELAQVRQLNVEVRPEPEEGKQPIDSPTDARISLLDFRGAQTQRLIRALGDEEERLRLALERLAVARERRRRATTAVQAREHELRKRIRVRLEGGAAGTSIRLVARYLVRGARWFPVYALRLDRELSSAQLEARAMVQQRTGEDWSGVALTLSTAAAQSWTELPELTSVRIGRSQPARRSTWRPPPTGAGVLYADHDAVFGPGEVGGLAPSRAAPPPEPVAEEEPDAILDDIDYELGAGPAVQASAGSFGGAPMPPPSAAPLASMAAPRSPMRRSKKRGRRQSKSDKFQYEPMEQSYESALEPEPAPEPPAPTQLRDFGVLRMAGPGDVQRGALRPGGDALPPEVRRALSEAVRATSGAHPAGCEAPNTVGGFDFAIAAEHPADVPADGVFHSIPVTSGEGTASARYVCVPARSSDVFRQVRLRSPLEAPILAGPADVHVGGRYALTTPLRHRPEGGELRLGLGVEQAIKVARNVRFDETKAGLIGGSIDLEHRVDIELKSHLAADAMVEVRERVPVIGEQEDEIVVTVGQAEPEWEEWEPEERRLRGGRRWLVQVPPGGETKLSATWNVRIPKGHELIGGNRRES